MAPPDSRLRTFVLAIGDEQGWGGGTFAPTSATYVTLSTNATLTSERVLTAGHGIDFVDAGAGSSITIDVDETELSAPLPSLVAGTWTGATSITTLGTIATGTWQGTAIAAAYLGSHTHAAGDVTSGTLATARLGTGTATGAVLVGGAWTSGTSSGHVLRWNGSAWASSALSASDISTGSIGSLARLGYAATTSDASTTSSTTGTTTNTPTWSVTTGTSYVLEVIGTMKSSIATNGWRCQIEESGGATSSKCVGVVAYVGAGDEPITAANTWTTQGSAPTAETHIHIRVLYVCTGSGTLKLGIRCEGAGPTVTLYAGTLYAQWEYP